MKYQLITKAELTAGVVNFSNGCNRVAAMIEAGDNYSPRFKKAVYELCDYAEFLAFHGLRDHGMVQQAWDRVSHHFA